MKITLLLPFSLLLFTFSGCFNEPEPAEKSVKAENRIYLQAKGLANLKGSVFDSILKRGAAVAEVDYLNLDRNQLTNVDEVAKLTGLKWLRLNENRLTALPSLASLTSLRRLYLRDNRLTAVPETVKDLPSLTDLELSGNPIREVPAWLAQKKGLKNVSLSRTQVVRLPEDLTAWKHLQSLQLGELNISAMEMARIRAALPDVAIAF